MSDHAWPSYVDGIHQPIVEGYGVEALPAVGRMDVEAGPPLQWPTESSDYRVARITWIFKDYAARATWDDWYHDTIVQGTLPFDIRLRDGHTNEWWTAMLLGFWEQSFEAPNIVRMSAQLLLIGEPSASRPAASLSVTFSTIATMRATATGDTVMSVTFDTSAAMTADGTLTPP